MHEMIAALGKAIYYLAIHQLRSFRVMARAILHNPRFPMKTKDTRK